MSEWERVLAAVGSTPFRPAKTLGSQLRIPNLHVKDEGANPGGSMAIRWASAEVRAALDAKLPGVVGATQGPAASALAYAAKAAGIACLLFEPRSLSTAWSDRARAHGATVERRDDDAVEVAQHAQEEAVRRGYHDATPLADASRRRSAYAPLGAELARDLAGRAAIIGIPTREGTALAGIGEGLRSSGAKAALLAATTKMGNPIVWSLARQLEACEDLEAKNVFPSETSEPLSCYHAHDGDAALQAVRASGGWGYAASDAELEALAMQLKRAEGLDALPAAMAGLAALHFAAKFDRLDAKTVHVAVLAARP